MPETIVVHGAPGSGKTTHGEKLAQLEPEKVFHVSIGNRLRSILLGEVDSQFKTEIDRQAAILAESKPLEHEVVNGVIFEFIDQCPTSSVVLVDGYPRFIEQLGLFFDSIKLGEHLHLGTIFLNISKQISLERLLNRGARDGEKQVEEGFASWRFDEYQNKTIPTIALLGELGKLIEVNAEQTVDDVWQNFYDAVDSLTTGVDKK